MDMGLEQIVIEQYQWILGLARKYCRNMMDAEDLAEETVLRFCQIKVNMILPRASDHGAALLC